MNRQCLGAIEGTLNRLAALAQSNAKCRKYLSALISKVIEFKAEDDIIHAFEQDIMNDFKTVLKWSM